MVYAGSSTVQPARQTLKPNKAPQLPANPLWTCPDKVDTFFRVVEPGQSKCCLELSTFMGQIHYAVCPQLRLVVMRQVCGRTKA